MPQRSTASVAKRGLLAFAALCASTNIASAQTTSRVSVSSAGGQNNGLSIGIALSGDASRVAFAAGGTALAPSNPIARSQIYVRNTAASTTTLVSATSAGVLGNNDSRNPSVSADGRYVAFDSYASNLVSGDTLGNRDIFVKDTQTGSIVRVSVGLNGAESNNDSDTPILSADGRYVAFTSYASNLVSGDTNGSCDFFVRDLVAGMTTRISHAADGTQGNSHSYGYSMTPDGRYFGYFTLATNFTTGDTNGVEDAFVYDSVTGAVDLVSRNSSGAIANDGSGIDGVFLSGDGRYVLFSSYATNLDPAAAGNTGTSTTAPYSLIYLRDRQTNTTTLVSRNASNGLPDNDCYPGSISSDGRFIAIDSFATNLVATPTNGIENAYITDQASGRTQLLSIALGGASGGDDDTQYPILGAGGLYAAFRSRASNLVSSDTNGEPDIFLRGPLYKSVVGTLGLVSGTAASQDFTVSVRQQPGNSPVYSTRVTVGATGAFSLLVDPGDYLLHIKGDRYLAKNVSVSASNGNASFGALALAAGDVVGDNQVDLTDLIALLNAYGLTSGSPSYNPNADLNIDGAVDLIDLIDLLNSYGLVGDN